MGVKYAREKCEKVTEGMSGSCYYKITKRNKYYFKYRRNHI